MTNKPDPPLIDATAEEKLERMKALTRRVLAAPKAKGTPKRKTKKPRHK
jgi:hypothetical protein